MEKYESSVKHINCNIKEVFRVLSDLRNVQMLLDAMQNPNVQEQFKNSIPADKTEEYNQAKGKIGELIKDVQCTRDTVTCSTSLGQFSIKVAEREAGKHVKISSAQSPVEFHFWAQVKEVAPYDTAVKLTLKADIPFMIKMMFSSKLNQLNDGIEKAAGILCQLPYSTICQRMDAQGYTEDPMLEA